MKLYLDDERPAPEGFTLVTNADDCIALLCENAVTEMSLDHDLGHDSDTGYSVLIWMETCVFRKLSVVKNFPRTIHIHTMNPSVLAKMTEAVRLINEMRISKEALEGE